MNELTNEEIIKSEYYGNRTKSVVYLEDEQFTPVKNHPDYLISQYGRVFSTKCNKMLTNQIDKDGYLRVTVDGVNSGVHRLVAYTYLPEDSEYYGNNVNHINGRKQDNSPENLEWLSNELNIDHACKYYLRDHMYGENNNSAIYTNEQVEKECQLLEKYPNLSSMDVAKLLGISNSDTFDKKYSDHITKVRKKPLLKI